jgi:hypothetical protein
MKSGDVSLAIGRLVSRLDANVAAEEWLSAIHTASGLRAFVEGLSADLCRSPDVRQQLAESISTLRQSSVVVAAEMRRLPLEMARLQSRRAASHAYAEYNHSLGGH